ncbi:cell division protein FtsZ [Candidatus Jorgensenbacteria bacterium]|nr:cell division protein FtsZ [Candidatus Jorgensenbacteria bacterium]
MVKKTKKNKTAAPRTFRVKQKRLATKIKVVGVGGGGGNIVSRMMQGDRIKGVEFIAVNTDAQDLDHTIAHRKIYIGKALTHGLGAGMNPDIGKQAAEENRSEIGEALDGADMVFVTAGLGGGTGTGGGPIVAEITREKGILTIAIVTKPFSFEGPQRLNIAQEGLLRLKDKVDALVVVPNDRIFSLISKDTPLMRAFGYVDDVLKNAVQAIADLINVPGVINVDFADIKSILKDAGTTLIGTGIAAGPERSIKAVNGAINSPLLEISIDGAKGVLFSVAGSRDLKMAEINDIAKAIAANLDQNARIIFGTYYDRALRDKSIKVTVIATGFNGMFSRSAPTSPTLFIGNDFMNKVTGGGEGAPGPREKKEKTEKGSEEEPPTLEKQSKQSKAQADKSEAWEIPAFLRKKRR